jgi:hypothetical protein
MIAVHVIPTEQVKRSETASDQKTQKYKKTAIIIKPYQNVKHCLDKPAD